MTLIHYIFHGSCNPPPDKGGTDKSSCRPDTGMMDVVELLDDLLSQGHGDDDPGLAGGRVVMENVPRWQASGSTGEARGVDQCLDVLAGLLGCSKLIQRAERDGVELLKHITGEGVSNSVVRARDVLYVTCELTDVGQLTCLLGRPGLTLPHQGLREGAVVGEHVEHAAGQHVAEVADAQVGGVGDLGGRQLSAPTL